MNADEAYRASLAAAGLTPDYEPLEGRFETQPEDRCAEDALLVAVLKRPAVLDGLDLSPLDFTGFTYRRCWQAILRLHERREPIDFVTLLQELGRMGQANANVLVADLWQTNGYAGDARAYLERIHDCAVRRFGVSGAAEDADALYDSSIPVDDVLARMEQRIRQIRRRRAAGDDRNTGFDLPDVA